jgi:hypothetical protein
LFDLVAAEIPDCAMTLHSCGSGPFFIAPETFISPACQFHQVQVAALVAERHRRDDLRPGGNTRTTPQGGFYFHTALHHHTGTLPLLFEFPHGLEMRYGVTCRYRPR